jgi:pimeloyl-ACP methyl ester carboxylesterase
MGPVSTIVLVHGGLGAELDADRFWVRPGIVERLRGHGHRVHAPDRPHHTVSWPAQSAELLPGLPSGPLVVVGGSNGCTVAVRLTLALGARVSRLALCWPATAGDPAVDAVVPTRLAPLLVGESLRGVTDAELATLTMPVAVLPSVPSNRFHQRSTVDLLLARVPGSRELPGSPEPPTPTFPSFVDGFVASLVGFAA